MSARTELEVVEVIENFCAVAGVFNDRSMVSDGRSSLVPISGSAAKELAAEWRHVERTTGVATLDVFLQWEAQQLRRFGRTGSPARLSRRIREHLHGPGTICVDSLLREDVIRCCEAFEVADASEAEMATVVCAVWWRRWFADILEAGASGFACESSALRTPRPRHVTIPAAMWTLAARTPSRDMATFEPSIYIPMIAGVVYSELKSPTPPEFLRLSQRALGRAFPVHQFETAREPRDFRAPWLRAAMLGGVLDAEGERPALVALLWAAETGVLHRHWDEVEAALEECAEFSRRWRW